VCRLVRRGHIVTATSNRWVVTTTSVVAVVATVTVALTVIASVITITLGWAAKVPWVAACV
tara:strand:+ start:103 stop:285 length:183 start_codon:yes stop_codon:yes gene_type:complete